MAIFVGQSFQGVLFSCEQEGMVLPMPSRESVYNVRHVPYSDRSVLDLAGQGVRQLRARVWVDQANHAALEALLQTTGTLVWNGVTLTATLVELSDKRKLFNGGAGLSYQALFLVD